MRPQPKPAMTPEDYLSAEREADFKSEYVGSEVLAMAGASFVHNVVAANAVGALWSRLRGGPCRVVPSDMRIKVGNQYLYSDVAVVCGEPRFLDERTDALLNPTVIIEVLSESTKNYDRGEKFMRYRQLDSLQEYVLVDPTEPHVEHFRRESGRWVLVETSVIEDRIALTSIGCDLPLAEIYERAR
ncbi:MAG: Uma2 family endonuclease [Thermoanaerobaculia bacterium]|nr:Uma2 family endonuclease [Thermoanaerobaculia bacterium]